jgi:hypothetical protein
MPREQRAMQRLGRQLSVRQIQTNLAKTVETKLHHPFHTLYHPMAAAI